MSLKTLCNGAATTITMKVKLPALLLILLCLLSVQEGYAQKKKKRSGKQEPTTNTSYGASIEGETTRKEYLYLYSTSSRGLLQGNKCVEDYTEARGFRYIVMPPGQEGSLTDMEMRLHNFGVKFVLLLKNGPFWHHRLSKRIKYCREKTGDYVG